MPPEDFPLVSSLLAPSFARERLVLVLTGRRLQLCVSKEFMKLGFGSTFRINLGVISSLVRGFFMVLRDRFPACFASPKLGNSLWTNSGSLRLNGSSALTKAKSPSLAPTLSIY